MCDLEVVKGCEVSIDVVFPVRDRYDGRQHRAEDIPHNVLSVYGVVKVMSRRARA